MRKYLLYITATAIIALSSQSCSEYFNHEPGDGYDILWPVPNVVIDFDSLTVDTEYTFSGENLDKVFQVFFGTDQAQIIDTLTNRMVVKTPRLFNKSKLNARNYYDYSFESREQIIPRYLPVAITKWPVSFGRKQSLTLEGENVDQIDYLLIGNAKIQVNGRSIEDPAYKKIIIPLTDAGIDSTLTKALVKAVGLNGDFLQAADSSTLN